MPSTADVELLDRVVTDAEPLEPASLQVVRLGVVEELLANTDDDTSALFSSALKKLESAGVEIVKVYAPELLSLNGAVGFPLALYEAYDDMVACLEKL